MRVVMLSAESNHNLSHLLAHPEVFSSLLSLSQETCGVRFGPKVGQISTKLDKSGTFSHQILVHYGTGRQNELKSDIKKSRIYSIWGQAAPLCELTWPPSI